MAGVNQTGRGDAGSTFDTSGTTRDFPAVPYTAEHFTPRGLCPSASGRKLVTVHESSHFVSFVIWYLFIKLPTVFCSGNVDDYRDLNNAYNCYLYGLVDLYGRSNYVRQTVANFLNQMIDIGVAGFLIDTAKNIWPEVMRIRKHPFQ